ncbi:CD63 antigen [Anthophora plagiata]
MGCAIGMIKYLLYIFNFIFAVCGLAILAIGVVAHLRLLRVNEQLGTGVTFTSVTVIVVGTIIFVVSFLGCCGAIRESHCTIITFASLLLFMLLIQVAVAVYTFVVIKNVNNHNFLTENYEKVFNEYSKGDKTDPAVEFIDFVQSDMQCCGVITPDDFMKRGNPIPWSCCGKQPNETCSLSEAYKDGCVQKLEDVISLVENVLGGIAIGVVVVELIGITFALYLANSIKNAQRRGYRV